MTRAVITILSLAILTSCVTGTDVLERVWVSDPIVTASPMEAAVGEFITVHIENSLTRFETGPYAPVTGDVELGVCLVPDWTGQLDNCDPLTFADDADFQPSPAFRLAPGDEASRELFLSVGRGETVPVSHTFRITATRPGTVWLIGKFVTYETDPIPISDSACVDWECATVTWH
jgi:hypothetical protein